MNEMTETDELMADRDAAIAEASRLERELEEAKEHIAHLERENAKLEGERTNLDDQLTRAREAFGGIMDKCKDLAWDADQLRAGIDEVYGDARIAEQA